MIATNKQSSFKVGEMVLISPEVTHEKEWIEGKIFKIEDNPYVGFVLNVETEQGEIYFEKEYLFKHLNKADLCMQ